MKRAVIVLLLILPSLACAESPTSREYSFFSSFIQMIAALSIVIGLILLARHFAAKFAGGSAAARLTSKHIRLVETRYISPKKSLLLIEVGGEYLLLANTENHLSLIKGVNVIEEIEVLEEPGDGRSGVLGIIRNAALRRRV